MFYKNMFAILLITFYVNQVFTKSITEDEKQIKKFETKRFVRSVELHEESDESDESQNKSEENDENNDNNDNEDDEDQEDNAGKSGDTLSPGQCLEKGDFLMSSNNCFKMIMQHDGNLVIYRQSGGAIWATKTDKTCSNRACMQGDGNFVVYDCHNKAKWSSKTYFHEGSSLKVQNDGNVIIYAWQSSRPIWSSQTRTYC